MPWLSPPLAETIAVEGLDAAGVGRMTQALLGVERVSAPLLDVLVDRGEGNPLYVEEILRQLRETGGLRVEDGEAQLSRPDVTVPATIHDIIAARIDRLPDDVKHTLQVAAVVGRQVAIPCSRARSRATWTRQPISGSCRRAISSSSARASRSSSTPSSTR